MTITKVLTVSRPTRAQLLARIPGFVAEVAKGASERDLSRQLPFEAFKLFRELELGTLRIPAALGGPGGSVADYIEMIAAIGAADSNVAHALRSHFNYVENVILSEPRERDAGAVELILGGKLFGGAHTEQGTARPGQVTTTIARKGDTYRLNGRKWYATGTAFADFASFSALDEEGQAVGVLLPVDRQGITILDDWDGMGQRLTASGGVILDNVKVFPHELARRALDNLVGRHCSTLRQLHLAASAAGAVRNVLSDGLAYVRSQARFCRPQQRRNGQSGSVRAAGDRRNRRQFLRDRHGGCRRRGCARPDGCRLGQQQRCRDRGRLDRERADDSASAACSWPARLAKR